MEELLKELEPEVLYKLHLFGVDMSITKAVILLWVAALIVFLLVWLGGRKRALVPSGMQNIMEATLDFVRLNMIIDVIGEKGMKYFPWIATLFLYILVANLIGLVPKSMAITGLTGTTAAWAVIVLILFNFAGIKERGFFGYLKSFIPPGAPIVIAIIMVPIEIISTLILRPFSLAVRLFANMTAGHMIILVFSFMAVSVAWWIKWLPLGGVVIMQLFEVFVSFIQAYIFAILASIYISLAISEH